jgi:hypothetical protein
LHVTGPTSAAVSLVALSYCFARRPGPARVGRVLLGGLVSAVSFCLTFIRGATVGLGG